MTNCSFGPKPVTGGYIPGEAVGEGSRHARICFSMFPQFVTGSIEMKWHESATEISFDRVRPVFASVIAAAAKTKIAKRKRIFREVNGKFVHYRRHPGERVNRQHQNNIEVITDGRHITEPVILICGHGGRDERCGGMGPLLEQEFKDQLESKSIDVTGSEKEKKEPKRSHTLRRARLGTVSHIGGHKYAGNVILYISPWQVEHPLAGMGIWYGRVEPKHVQGIVEETLLKGNVIEELFRGGIDYYGQPLTEETFKARTSTADTTYKESPA